MNINARRGEMNMKTKKCGVFAALAAALLVTAALITSCVEPISPGGLTIPQEKQLANFQPPSEGKGYLWLNVVNEGSGARTVLPSGTPTRGAFVIIATGTSGTTGTETSLRITDINNTPFSVPVGTYNVEVRAYATTANTDTEIVAVGTAENPVVVTGAGTTGGPVTVVQHEIYDGSGAGEFGYAFTFTSAAPTTASMVIKEWPSGSVVSTTNVVSASSGSVPLDSGYYYVDVTLGKQYCRSQTYTEIVHIANGMTSTWTKTNFLPLASNVYTVTYNYNDATPTITPVPNQTHGGTISAPTEPTWSGHTFGGWFKDDGTFSDPWVFATAKLMGDIDLYAKWTTASMGDLSVSVSFALDHDTQEFTLSSTSETYSKASLALPGSHIVNITITGTGLTDIVWTYEGEHDTLTWSGASIAIDLDDGDNADLLLVDTHVINVEAKVGGVGYSATDGFSLIMTN